MKRGKKADERTRGRGSSSGRLPTEVITQIIRGTQTYAMLGLALGVVIVLGGLVLIVLGFTGSVDITFESGSSKGHVTTGSLGIVIALVGIAIVFFTKPRLEVTPRRVVRRRRPGR